jgi:hypothetical protein
LTEDVPEKVISDRMNVGEDVLDKHFDRHSNEVKVEQRRGLSGRRMKELRATVDGDTHAVDSGEEAANLSIEAGRGKRRGRYSRPLHGRELGCAGV